MWRRLKASVEELLHDPPGQRFRARYWRWKAQGRESYLATAFYVALGLIAVMLGIVFSFWPIIPGFVFVLAGLALLSARSQWLANSLDRLELAIRRMLPRRWQRRGRSAN
jgi:hypothetical protein